MPGSGGSTVDVTTVTYTNTVGETMLGAHWNDPEFDDNEHAFHYVRVLENPARWTTYDAVFYGMELPDNVPTTLQDRAYIPPIWYTLKI